MSRREHPIRLLQAYECRARDTARLLRQARVEQSGAGQV
jgi:hypothetical protein